MNIFTLLCSLLCNFYMLEAAIFFAQKNYFFGSSFIISAGIFMYFIMHNPFEYFSRVISENVQNTIIMNPIVISDDTDLDKEWYAEARVQTPDSLMGFIKHLMYDYRHSYSSIVYALSAGAVATCWAMNKSPQGGISGFQASAIMWEFLKAWMSMDGPLKLTRYDDMLYPQYDYKFEKTITRSTWAYLQDQAEKRLKEGGSTHPNVKKHWESIVAGEIPFGYTVVED